MTKRYFSFICKKVFAFICERVWKAYFSYSFPQSKQLLIYFSFSNKTLHYHIGGSEGTHGMLLQSFILSIKEKLLKGCTCQWCSYWSCLNYKHSTLKASIFTELLSYIISLSTCQVHINLNHAFPPSSLVILPKHELKIQIINI